nr:uncharacterized protein LOC127336970 [Lolium perenne]XP_051219795.1 uncharacterized protein LOC127336970 [Lolium perenne]
MRDIKRQKLVHNSASEAVDKTAAGVPELNSETWSAVFLRLDASDVYKCQFLSPVWRRIIRTPDFVASYRDMALQSPNQMFLFRSYADPSLDVNGSLACFTDIYGLNETPHGHCILRSSEIFLADGADNSHEYDDDSTEMELSRANQAYYIHDSCEGMLLISMGTRLVVYNPFIRRWGRLPELGDIKLAEGKTICAFFATGEANNREFKILYRSTTAFNIYSLNSKAHKVVPHIDEIGSGTTPLSTCLADRLSYGFSMAAVKFEHWLCWWGHHTHSVLFFDTKTEKFQLIDIPEVDEGLTMFQLLTMKGKLAAAVYSWNPDNIFLPIEQCLIGWPSSTIDVWVLDDMATSLWRKHLSLEPPRTTLLRANNYMGNLEYDVLLVNDAETVLLPCIEDLLVCGLDWSIRKKIRKDNHHVIPLCISIEQGFETHSWLDQTEVPFVFSQSDTDQDAIGDSSEESSGDDADGDGDGDDDDSDDAGDDESHDDSDEADDDDGDDAGDDESHDDSDEADESDSPPSKRRK